MDLTRILALFSSESAAVYLRGTDAFPIKSSRHFPSKQQLVFTWWLKTRKCVFPSKYIYATWCSKSSVLSFPTSEIMVPTSPLDYSKRGTKRPHRGQLWRPCIYQSSVVRARNNSNAACYFEKWFRSCGERRYPIVFSTPRSGFFLHDSLCLPSRKNS